MKHCQTTQNLLITFFLSACTLCSAAVENILQGNPSFEIRKDGQPEHIHISGGKLESITDAVHGKYAVKYTTEKGRALNFFSAKWTHPTPVRQGDVYTFSFRAKGKGTIAYLIPQNVGIMFKRSLFGKHSPLKDDWTLYEYKIKIIHDKINRVLPGIAVSSGGWAVIDDMRFTYDPAENEGRPSPVEKAKEITLPVKVEYRDAAGSLKINGKKATSLQLKEGFNVVEITLQPKGKNAAFRLKLPGNMQYLADRWKIVPDNMAKNPAISELACDDRAWKPATVTNGWCSGGTAFRGVILWSFEHYGTGSAQNMKMKEYMLPSGSVQNLELSMGPNGYPRSFEKDYKIDLWLPEGVTLMDLTQEKPRYVLNQAPVNTKKNVERINGENYTHYTFDYSPKQLQPYKANGVQPKTVYHFRVADKKMIGKKSQIMYRRSAEGNFTEITKVIPVRFIGPINGKQPSKIRIQLYSGVPLGGISMVNTETFCAMLDKAKSLGINSLMGSFYRGWEKWDDLKQKKLKEHSIRYGLWPFHGFPMHTFYMGLQPFSYYDELCKNKEMQATYFGSKCTWGENPFHYTMYCPSYMLTTEKGRKFYAEAVEAGLKLTRGNCTNADFIFYDWESDPWVTRKGEPGNGSYCFCERCRAEFAKENKLSAVPDAKTIHEKYYKAWEKFRTAQNNRLMQVVYQICHKMNLKVMFYTQTQMTPYYHHAGGPYDIFFLGYPAKKGADSSVQKDLDNFRKQLNQYYPEGMIAQIFPCPSNNGSAQDGSVDGIYVQSRWKTMTLRLLATYRIGIDIENVDHCLGGIDYYIGEATRAAADLEEFFLKGKREDAFRGIKNMAYPDMLGLTLGKKRMLLLFNDKQKSRKVTLSLKKGEKARAYYSRKTYSAGNHTLTIPAENAEILIVE